MTDFYDDNEDVVNSSLYSIEDNTDEEYYKNIFNDSSLKVGIVIKAYEIDDKLNKNKKIPEYDILVVEQKETSTMEPLVYKNCISIDGFGGVADFFEYKLRPVKTDEKDTKAFINTNFEKQFGNMVLLLCLDGVRDKGIIIKSVSHKGRKTNLTKDNGLHLEGQYNGLNWQINKDGELKITYKSKTDEKGKPADEKAGGTHFQIDKKGSVDINTNLEGDDETYMRMDKENKDVGLKAGANIGLTAKKNIGFNAEADIKGAAKANVEFAAEGSAKFTSKSSFKIESDSALNMKGASIKAESDDNFFIKGTQVFIDAPMTQVGTAALPAVVPTTFFLGIGNLGVPILSVAVGPFSGSVMIGI